MADRLIVEVENFAYGQWQIEVYTHVKLALKKTSPQITTFGNASWSEVVSTFLNEAIVEQEARKLGSHKASEAAVKAAFEVVNKKVAANPALQQEFDRLKVSPKAIQSILSMMIRIRGFVSSKEKSQNKEPKELRPLELFDASQPWFQKLKTVTPYRFFEGGRTYVRIFPVSSL